MATIREIKPRRDYTLFWRLSRRADACASRGAARHGSAPEPRGAAARPDRHGEIAARLVQVAVDHVAHAAVCAADDHAAGDGVVGLSGAHRSALVNPGQLLNECDRRGVNAERLKGAGPLAVAVERFEVQSDVGDGAGGDGQVVALGPARSIVELDRTTKGLGHSADGLSADERAPDPARERLRGDEGRGLTVSVVLGEKTMDDAGAEEEPELVVARPGASERLDAHDVPVDAGERCDRALRVGVDQATEEALGLAVADAHGVRDGVHRAPAE